MLGCEWAQPKLEILTHLAFLGSLQKHLQRATMWLLEARQEAHLWELGETHPVPVLGERGHKLVTENEPCARALEILGRRLLSGAPRKDLCQELTYGLRIEGQKGLRSGGAACAEASESSIRGPLTSEMRPWS